MLPTTIPRSAALVAPLRISLQHGLIAVERCSF